MKFLLLSYGVFLMTGVLAPSNAAVTDLVYALQEGKIKSLEKAYFQDEIDFFLDYRGVQNSEARELYALREAGRAVAKGETVSAKNFLRGVQRYPDQKLYIESVIHAAEGQLEKAQNGFRSLIERRQKIDKNLLTQAFIAAARTAHEAKDYKQAIFYYTQVSQLDPYFFQAIFEKTWSFYMQGDMNGALGASLSFVSPYSDHVFYPESFIVRAAGFFHLCLYEQANLVIEDMKNRFGAVQAQLKELQKMSPNRWFEDERILNSMDSRILGYFIRNQEFRSLYRAFRELNKERTEFSGQRQQTANTAFEFVQSRLYRQAAALRSSMQRDLDVALAEANKIQIEILQLGVNLLTGAPIESRSDIQTIELGNVDFHPQIQFWPFKKEFWLDELGSYYYGLKSACG